MEIGIQRRRGRVMGDVIQLNSEIEKLETRHDAVVSKMLVKTDDLRILLIALGQGASLPEHHADARISIHVLQGVVRFSVGSDGGETIELSAGALLPLERAVRHAATALERSILLVTMAWPPASELKSLEHRGYA
jgi:quercetin dioxygenase-like cupin family protein